MFKVTKEWMLQNRTTNGGWNAAQLRQLNEYFPLKAGWKKRCIGKLITEEQKEIFELGAKSKNAARRANRKLKYKELEKANYELGMRLKANATPSLHTHNTKPDARASDAFLQTYEWRKLRMEALKKYGAKCQCCGSSPATGAVMNVDHIKPRKYFPHLALDLANLQVLCHECNHGKGNWDMTDWRQDDEYYKEVETFVMRLPNL